MKLQEKARGRQRDAGRGTVRPERTPQPRRRAEKSARTEPGAAPVGSAVAGALRLRGTRALLSGTRLPGRLPGAQHNLAAAWRLALDVVAPEPPREAGAPGGRL